jgi:hypothetical protein
MKLDPLDCTYELIAFGPIFPEQSTMELHRKYRDQIAPLESALVYCERVVARSLGLTPRGTARIRAWSPRSRRHFGPRSDTGPGIRLPRN